MAGDLVSFLGDSAAAPLHLLGGPGQHVPDQVLPEAVVSLSSLRIQRRDPEYPPILETNYRGYHGWRTEDILGGPN